MVLTRVSFGAATLEQEVDGDRAVLADLRDLQPFTWSSS